MNLIDKALAPFFPGTVAQRLAARMAIQAYEAASPTRLHKARSERRSGDSAVQVSAKSLREQARYLDENHDIVTGVFDRLEERIVGPNGIGVEPLPLKRDGTTSVKFRDEIKKNWAEWSLRPDTSGELSRGEVERLVCRTWLRDGEALAQHVYGTIPTYRYLTDVPYALEILEPDYLPLHLDDEKKGIRQGIERDQWRRVRAYHLHKKHPADDAGLRDDLKRVVANEIVHIANRKRIGQSRGVSILHSVMIRLADLKDYEESERVAARIAAALTMYIKKGDPGLYTAPGANGETDETTGSRQFSLAPGMVFDGLSPGEDVGMLESNRPSALLEGFRESMLRAVASGTRVGYSTLSRNYNGTYSAQRQELVEAQSGYEVLQSAFIDQWARKVYRKWLEVAILTRKIKIPKEVDPDTVYNAVYMAPVMPWIDPKKEADAWNALVEGGFATEAEVVRARGKDPAELKTARIAEVEENREADLVFGSDAYHKHYSASATEEPEDDDLEDENLEDDDEQSSETDSQTED